MNKFFRYVFVPLIVVIVVSLLVVLNSAYKPDRQLQVNQCYSEEKVTRWLTSNTAKEIDSSYYTWGVDNDIYRYLVQMWELPTGDRLGTLYFPVNKTMCILYNQTGR